MSKKTIRTLMGRLGWALAATALMSAPALAQQASINLEGSSLTYCNATQNSWKIEKVADSTQVTSPGTVTWTITATKNPDGPPPPLTLCAEGTITISNSGAAPATVGNIVVNLQKQVKIAGKWRWVSAAANVATSCDPLVYPAQNCGDAATAANIVAGASAENPSWNAAGGAGNYTVNLAGVGRFTEGPASGSIEFTDNSNNSLFSITPDFTVLQGLPITLKYKANFNNDLLAIPGGTILRTEVIVTFGNAGGRGGSGANVSIDGGVDINGNGSSGDPGENHVRSVPIRLTSTIPQPVNCNNEVSLTDLFTSTDNVSYTTMSGGVPATTDKSDEWEITTLVTLNSGSSGTITNNIDLFSKPPYSTDLCCEQVDEHDEASVTVVSDCTPGSPGCDPPPPDCRTPHLMPPGACPKNGQFCTFTIGGWANNGAPGQFAETYWSSAYPGTGNGPETGIPGTGGYSAKFTSRAAVRAYKDNGTSGPFTADHVNPISTSGGTFAEQVLGQVLALGFSAAGPFGSPSLFAFNQGYGNLMVSTDYGSFSVSTLVGLANLALGGAPASAYAPFDIPQLNDLMSNLNEGFDECVISTEWAQRNVTNPNPQ